MANPNNPKPWENADPQDKNLESLRNGLALENIMHANVLTAFPDAVDMKEGQMRQVFVGGIKYIVSKHNGILYKYAGTPV